MILVVESVWVTRQSSQEMSARLKECQVPVMKTVLAVFLILDQRGLPLKICCGGIACVGKLTSGEKGNLNVIAARDASMNGNPNCGTGKRNSGPELKIFTAVNRGCSPRKQPTSSCTMSFHNDNRN